MLSMGGDNKQGRCTLSTPAHIHIYTAYTTVYCSTYILYHTLYGYRHVYYGYTDHLAKDGATLYFAQAWAFSQRVADGSLESHIEVNSLKAATWVLNTTDSKCLRICIFLVSTRIRKLHKRAVALGKCYGRGLNEGGKITPFPACW